MASSSPNPAAPSEQPDGPYQTHLWNTSVQRPDDQQSTEPQREPHRGPSATWRKAPTVLARRSSPKQSTLCSVLWHFAAERHNIYLRRLQGRPAPWSSDPILCNFKFTNSFRAADRVSQYFIRLAHLDPNASSATLFLRALLFKIFNKIETWELIVSKLGLPRAETFDYRACDNLLSSLRTARTSIYSGAYIMPSPGGRGIPKHRSHLALVQSMLEDDLPSRIIAAGSLEGAYRLLGAYPSLGPFLAYQYTIDLNYTYLLDHSEMTFVVPGPGARDGLSKCFLSLGDYTPADTIRWLTERQEEEFDHHGISFEGLWGRPLQLIDVQNLLCEVSKYTRASHPHVIGSSGRLRIKQRFRPTGDPVPPFFPPKWGLNEKAAAWLSAAEN